MLLLLLVSTVSAATFGGLDMSLLGELDETSELLLDVGLAPVVQGEEGASRDTYGLVRVDYGFLEDQDRLDRLDATAVRLDRPREKGQVNLSVDLGRLRFDQDDGYWDLVPAAGRIDVLLVGEGFHLLVGATPRYRRLTDLEGDTNPNFFFVGVPVGVALHTPVARPLFAEGHLLATPNIRILGDEPFAFDLDGRVAGGYRLVQGGDLVLTTQVFYDLGLDTQTSLGLSVVHRLGAGLEVRF